jgi:hypothetical protein
MDIHFRSFVISDLISMLHVVLVIPDLKGYLTVLKAHQFTTALTVKLGMSLTKLVQVFVNLIMNFFIRIDLELKIA